tara:strand:- start:148 stop:360 length:213 start_codon:yes stop_codon:yes gene_type:complete
MSRFQKRWIEGKTIESVEALKGLKTNYGTTFTSLASIYFTDGSRIDLDVETLEHWPAVKPIYRKAPKVNK